MAKIFHLKSGRFLNLALTIIVCFFLVPNTCGQEPILTSDKNDYAPGSTATLTGSGFQSGEPVKMQVVHADGKLDTGAEHDIWYVTADANGVFVTTWHVCEDDCVGSTLKATAEGQTSPFFHAETTFTDANVTILSGQTINASTLSDGDAIAIYGGGTLNMDVSKTFVSVITATGEQHAYTSVIGPGTLTTGVITVNSGNGFGYEGTFSVGQGTTIICTSILRGNTGDQDKGLNTAGYIKISNTVGNFNYISVFESSTFEFSGGDQTLFTNGNYANLILSGNGVKTFPAGNSFVNTKLSIQGGATTQLIGTLIYTNPGLLEYKGSIAQTTGAEFPSTFSGPGGVIINNNNGVTLNSSKTISGQLQLLNGNLNIPEGTMFTLNGAVSRANGLIVSAATGTVNYNQSSNGQAVIDGTYGNLTFSNFNKVLSPTGTIGIAGTFSPGTATGHTLANSTVLFNGITTQVIPSFNYHNLASTGGRKSVADATIGIAGIFSYDDTGINTSSTSIVEFNGTGSQTITSNFPYVNLTISGNRGNNSVTLPSGNIKVFKNFNSSATFTSGGGYIVAGNTFYLTGLFGSSAVSGNPVFNNLTLQGNINFTLAGTVNGQLLLQSTSTVENAPIYGPDASLKYQGEASQTTGPEFLSTMNARVIIDNTNGVTLNASKTVNAAVTFTNGKLTTGASTLILGASGSISGAGANKYVYGNLRRYVPATANVSIDFPVGDATNYTPATVLFAGTPSGSGYLDASTSATAPTSGSLPAGAGLDPAKYVNRRWVITNNDLTGFTSYSPTFTFVASDIQNSADPTKFIISKLNGSTWTTTAIGAKSSTSTQATGLTTFSEFAIGEPVCIPPSQPANFTTSASTVCQGQSGVTYTIPNDPAATSYTWTYNGSGATFSSITNSVSIDFSNAATSGKLSVVANGCAASPAREIDITVNTSQTFYRDADGDDFGNISANIRDCSLPTGYVTNNTDCEDNNAAINPDATEICGNGVDDNCDGQIDEGCLINKPKVLLVAADDERNIDDVQNKLLATGKFLSVDRFQVGNEGSIPTVPFLLQYDAILVWSNYPFLDRVLLGNNIASYIDSGGGVVTAEFTMEVFSPATTASTMIDGSFANDVYRVMVPSGNPAKSTATLGDVPNSNHPLMAGINTFTGGYKQATDLITPGSYVVASWSSNYPLIVAKDDVGPAHVKRVDLNFFPASRDAIPADQDLWDSATDGANIMANALLYVAPPKAPIIYYRDFDGDGFGNPEDSVSTPAQPDGYVTDNTDCNDTDNAIYPSAPELCDGIDNNCDGQTDEGCPAIAAGALNYDGVDDYVDLGSSFNYQTFSIEMWVKPGATQKQYANIIDNNHTDQKGWVIQQNGTNLNQYYFGGSTGISPTFTLIANVWQHIALVCTPTSKTIYVNGTPEVTQTGTPLINYDGSQFLRLGMWGNGGRNWNGNMDELRIWNYALCQSEIQHYMNEELPVTSGNGLLAYYKFNSGYVNSNNTALTTLIDETGVSNGVLQNFGLIGSTSNWISGNVSGTALALVTSNWYIDADGDGYGNPNDSQNSCTPPEGYVSNNTDCNDNDATIYLGAPEICDNKDNNCNGLMDEIIANTWVVKQSIPVSPSRTLAAGFNIGNKGYITTGYNNQNDFWEYNPATNTWTRKADFPGSARYGAVSFGIGNKGYIGTGSDGSNDLKDFWEYDPATDVWTKKADFEGAAREIAVGFSIGNKGYIGSGRTQDYGLYTDFWEYDPATDSWVQKADFAGGARYAASGFSIGTKGYIGTGTDFTGGGFTYRKDFWEYDPSRNTWTQKADFGGGVRELAVGFGMNSKGYIGTGLSNNDFWEYAPFTDLWTKKADFGGGSRNMAVGFAINSKGYIGTGQGDTFWEYEDIIYYYRDVDGDGFGDVNYSTTACTQPEGYVSNNTDCNDNNAAIHTAITYYRDADADGYGTANTKTTACSNTAPIGFVSNSNDCDDSTAAVNPNTIWYLDADNDGYYTGSGVTSCTSPGTNYKYSGLLGGNDCNNNNTAINPGKAEICGNGIDDNCDGQVDEGCPSKTLLNISDATVYESEGTVGLTVTLTKTTTVAVSVTYKTVDGTARSKAGKNNPTDYTAASGTLTIPAGSQSGTISVSILRDNITEPSEYFDVLLSRPVNAAINDGSGRVTIMDGLFFTASKATDTKTTVSSTKEPNTTDILESLTVAPNPVKTDAQVRFSLNEEANVTLRLYDFNGREIFNLYSGNAKAKQVYEVGFLRNNLMSGVYIIKLTTEQGNSYTKRVIVE